MTARRWRQMFFVMIGLVAILGGYLAGAVLRQNVSNGDSTAEPSSVQAWYKDQPPAPSFLTKEDALPIYEEHLPDETFTGVEPRTTAAPVEAAAVADRPPEPASIDTNVAWRKYAVAVPVPAQSPVIAILIDDMGVDAARSARVAALPGPLTLAYLPYSKKIVSQTNVARAGGHELMVHVSMQPSSDAVDPGPNVLKLNDGAGALRTKIEWALGQFEGYVGINNHMGSQFSADVDGMRVVLDEMADRGLFFVDSRTTTKTVGARLARELGVPHAQRNLFLDNVNTEKEVRDQLGKLEKMAKSNGFALAIGHPREGTIRALAPWLAGLNAKGITLVPVSYLIARNIDAQASVAR